MNTLADVFEAQKELNEKTIPHLYAMLKENPSEREIWLIRYELAMRMEMAEMIESLHWKWWKHQETDWDNVKIELVDILHFWVSMCTVAGLEADEVIALYFKKNKLNHKRQDQGYQDGTYDKYKEGVEDNVREVLEK